MRKRAFEFWLDALLLAAFLLLLSPRMTGLAFHEWIGIAFVVPIIVHVLLSWNWIGETTKRMFTSADRRTRVNYTLNATLFVLICIEIISGLVISQAALPSVGVATINDRAWRALHNQTLNLTHFAVGLHVALNWPWILSALRGRLSARGAVILAPSWTRGIGRGAAVLLGACAVAAAALTWLGPPAESRRYYQDEIGRFAPTFGHGLGQFAGEAMLLAAFAYAGRRWMGVRL